MGEVQNEQYISTNINCSYYADMDKCATFICVCRPEEK